MTRAKAHQAFLIAFNILETPEPPFAALGYLVITSEPLLRKAGLFTEKTEH